MSLHIERPEIENLLINDCGETTERCFKSDTGTCNLIRRHGSEK